MNTQENNKLIAEFMGGEYVDEYLIEFKNFYSVKEIIEGEFVKTNCFDSDNELQYHKSWDWLMPVVSKCRVQSNAEDSHWEAIYYSLEGCDIDVTHHAVVEFIKWYNK